MSNNCNDNTTFKGVNNISEDLLLNVLEANLKMYLDWSFLNIGGWFDVNIPNNDIYGGNQSHILLPVDDPSYESGRVWQGIRKDWVWETGINFQSTSPINIDQIIINDFLVAPKSNGTYIINYPLGRIILNEPLSQTSKVTASYSYRFVQVHRSSESPWFNIVQYSSFNNSNPDIQKISDGEWSIGGHHRVQLPAIIVEAFPRSRSRPYEIGNRVLWLEQDIGFYVLAETKNDRNKLLDIIRLQQDSTLTLFDTNLVSQNDAFPLDYNGDIKNGALMYPDLVDQYTWKKCFLKNISLFEIDSVSPYFHQGMARATAEVIST